MTAKKPIDIAKTTWLSGCPKSWKLIQFKHLFEITKNSSLQEVPQVLSLTQNGVTERDVSSNEGQLSSDYSQAQAVCRGDFLLNPMDLLSGWVAMSEFEGVTSNAYFVFRPRNSALIPEADSRFLLHVMQMYYKQGILEPFGKGVGRPENGGGRWTLNRNNLNSIPLPVPPLDEQKAIADFLDRELAQIDSLVIKQLELMEQLKIRRYSAISELLRFSADPQVQAQNSGIDWLGNVAEDARLVRLRFLASVNTGFGDTQDANPDGAFDFYVRSDTVERSDTYDFSGPAVLTSGDGAGVGKVYHLAKGKFKAHQRCYVMKDFRGVSAEYFYWYFSTYFINEVNPGTAKSTVESLRRPMLMNFPILVHSAERQDSTVRAIESIAEFSDRLIAHAEKAIEKLRERRQSLISAAVTGKIDVRKVS